MEKVLEMSFEELYRLVNDGRELRKFVMEESTRRGVPPSEILFLVIRIYRQKVKEMALKN